MVGIIKSGLSPLEASVLNNGPLDNALESIIQKVKSQTECGCCQATSKIGLIATISNALS